MKRRRGLSLLLALAMLLTLVPLVGASAAEGDVTEVTYVQNNTGNAVTAYYKNDEGVIEPNGNEIESGALLQYQGEETVEDKTYYKTSSAYVLKEEDIDLFTHRLNVTGAGSFEQQAGASTVYRVAATVVDGNGKPVKDYSVQYQVDGGEPVPTPVPSLSKPGKLEIVITAERSGYTTLQSTVTLEVKAPAAVLVVESASFPYDNQAHTITAKVENGEGYKIEYSTDGGTKWSETAPSRTAVGKTTVKVRATKEGAEKLEKEVTLEVTASDASPKLVVSGGTVKYDGKAYTVGVEIKNGKIDAYKIEYSTDNKTWSENKPGVSAVGSKVTIYVRATPKSGEGETLTGSGVVEIIANTVTKTIATVVRCKTSVNVRAGAGTNTKKIGTAKKGAKFECLGKSDDGNWYKIQYNSTTVAYIHKNYIDTSEETVEVPVEVAVSGKVATVVNCKTSVNVRAGAGTTNSIIGQGKKNAQFTLLATVKVNGDTWYKVQYTTSKVGYIHENYIKVSDAGSSGTPSGNIATIVNCRVSVNVRSGPGTSNSKIGTAPKGEQYTCLGVSDDGNWYKIQYTSSKEGYVYKDYIELSTGSASQPDEPTGQTVTIINCNEWVNVREGAGTNTKKLGTAPKNGKYTYLGKTGNWVKVQYTATQVGYIYSKYVSSPTGGSSGTDTGGTSTETAQTGYGYVVNCNTSVNVRSAATSSANNIIGQAKKSYVYQILAKSGSWYKIQYTSTTVGYIHESYFTKATSDTSIKLEVVNCDTAVNVRNAATTSAALLGTAKKVETFTFLKMMNNYAMVIYNGRVGCIHKNFAKVG